MRLVTTLLLTALASSGQAAEPRNLELLVRPIQPEAASQPRHVRNQPWRGERMAVAAANPLAAATGLRILQAGGNAVDAAVAVQMVLGLVEPQSSGIGGGGFLLHWDGQLLRAWDGRETAPAGADEQLLLDAQGQPLPFLQAVNSGRSVGTPGLLAMLEQVHRRHGQLPWGVLLVPAIELAEQGFAVSPRLHELLKKDPLLRQDPAAASFYYHADGRPLAVGSTLRNPAMASILRRIARKGSQAFYRGTVAESMVRRVQQHVRPGTLSLHDLRYYRALQREPLCKVWLQRYRVCGMPPPSSGWLTSMQILGLLEQLPVLQQPLQAGLPTAEFLHRYQSAAQLAFADRARYIADPEFVAPPGNWLALVNEGYLRQRASLIGAQPLQNVQPGNPGGAPLALASQRWQPEYGTSHISIIDAEGQAISMTSSIEQAFGSRLLSDGGSGLPGGFLLNNQLTDFSFQPYGEDGKPIANRVQPGKRPRSSMNPLLVFDAHSGELLASLGSPGGAAIIHFTARTLLGLFDWQRNAQRAVEQPNFASFGGPILLEAGRFPASTLQQLRDMGHRVQEADLTSGLQVLRRRGEVLEGGADPRREGRVAGE